MSLTEHQSKEMTIGIIGAGAMGAGIAQVAAMSGCKVNLFDSNQEALFVSNDRLRKVLSRLIEKGKISEEQSSKVIANINYCKSLDELSTCDLVIEAIVEDLEIKKKVFSELEELVSDHCIIASNTSSLSVTSLAACLQKANRLIGIHFFNPAPVMKLVEVIPALQTDQDVVQQVLTIVSGWNKQVVLAKDTPGFIVNKVARPFYGEALRIYDEGLATFATIDHAMRSIGGFRMGPFELMDFIGNDVNFAVTESVFNAFYQDPRYKPSITQKRMAEAKFLGRKTGKGYYEYGENASTPSPDEGGGQQIFDRILAMLINEAADTLHFGIASKEDIDSAMKSGVNYPKGLLQWADEIGVGECVKKLDDLYDEYKEDRYRCSPMLRRMAENNQVFYG